MIEGKYKVYPKYEDSGVEWLGQVPGHWKIASIGRLFDIKAGGDLKEEFFSKDKTIQHCYPIYTNTVVSKQVYGFTNKPFFKKNTITVTGRGDVGYAIYRDHSYDAIIRLLVLSPRDKKTCKFFMYYLNSVLDFKVENTAINQLSTMQISPYRITYPTFEEQIIIINFLDHETAKIDNLIEKQKRLIKLIKEKRQAVISHAVTKGLNPDAPMKDSGVEWLGEVPEHWNVNKLKHLTRLIIDGAHFTPTYVDDGIPFLRVTDLHNKEIDKSQIKYIPKEEHENLIERCKPEKGDLLLSKNGTIGLTKVIDWEWAFSIFVSLCLIKFKRNRLLADYFQYIFKSSFIEEQLFHSSKKTSVSNLHLDKIKELLFIIPPLNEQENLIGFLDLQSKDFEILINKANSGINLLKERRTALISAAVTGKIDVRDWKKPGDIV